MDRLDEITAHLAILGTLSHAARYLSDEMLELAKITPQPTPPVSSSAATAGSDIDREENNATILDPDSEALRRCMEGLLAEGNMWMVKARPLMLEAAMREGNPEEGERLRREVKEDGMPVRAGEPERYFKEMREDYLGGMRGGMVSEIGI
ncbi:hypothetical protein DL98DRAFT_508210 [Cadophora sp. DSE1049]|nr:hypothetical protein DL98DRAFT_508210 [Cadophora sp. DSE1049]